MKVANCKKTEKTVLLVMITGLRIKIHRNSLIFKVLHGLENLNLSSF